MIGYPQDYIHYHFENYEESVAANVMQLNEAVHQNYLNYVQKEKMAIDFTSVTIPASQFLDVVINNKLDNYINMSITNNNKSYDALKSIQDEGEFDFAQSRKNLFSIINEKMSDDKLKNFKSSLQKIVDTICKELGYSNYEILSKMVVSNVKNNYGMTPSENQIYKDFLSNCNNSKFEVSSAYKGLLTSSINKIVLLINSLTTFENSGSLSLDNKSISDLVNKTVGWVDRLATVTQEIAIESAKDNIKHQLANILKNTLIDNKNSKRNELFLDLEVSPELEKFIETYSKQQAGYSLSYDGVYLNVSKDFVEININLDLSYQQTRKVSNSNPVNINLEYSNTISNAVKIIDAEKLNFLASIGSSHANNGTTDVYLSEIYSNIISDITKNALMNKFMTNSKGGKSSYYIIDGQVYKEGDVLQYIYSGNKVKTEVNLDRTKLTQMNRWIENKSRTNMENATVRSNAQNSNFANTWMSATLSLQNLL